jgi:predicted nucleic acid-binding protein
MIEIIGEMEHSRSMPAGAWLIDTCYFLYSIENHRDIEGYMTSFNAEELIHVEHRLHDDVKKATRKLLRSGRVRILDIDVHPGDREGERKYVDSVDPQLLKHVHDPSDAVLAAAAIRNRANIRTRDKHHLYTSDLKNFIDVDIEN